MISRFKLCRQTQQLLCMLPILPAGDALSINGNTGIAGDTVFALAQQALPWGHEIHKISRPSLAHH